MAQPDILTIPFAANAAPETINPIPISREPTDPAQQATWSEGFPRVTMQPMATGGIPPKGQDMNGALKAISEHIVYMGSGGLYSWSDAWVAAKGGYPLGAVLQSNDGRSAYVNIVEGNAVNFNTTPSSIGVSWLPFAGNGALSGKVDKTTQVIAGGGLTGGGALGGDRTLAIGTPSTLSGSSTNEVTEDSHTHAVEAATESVAGVARIATTAQAQALVDDATVITPKKLADAFRGANQSLVENGYQVYPGGALVQWGHTAPISISETENIITLPISFQNSGFSITATHDLPAANYFVAVSARYVSKSQISIRAYAPDAQAGASVRLFWVAIGN